MRDGVWGWVCGTVSEGRTGDKGKENAENKVGKLKSCWIKQS